MATIGEIRAEHRAIGEAPREEFECPSGDLEACVGDLSVAGPMSRAEAIAYLTKPDAPYALQTIEARDQTIRWFPNGPRTLREIYEASVCDEEFLVYGDERQTFREAWRAAGRVANVLMGHLGVAKGDRVAIAMRNYPEWVHAFTAITSIGAVAVALNALWSGEELTSAIALSGARVVIADEERIRRILDRGAPEGVTLVGVRCQQLRNEVVQLCDLLDQTTDAAPPDVNLHPDGLATLFFTSGSTGRAKGVPSTHRNIVTALLSWELDTKCALLERGLPTPTPDRQPAALLAIPLFHVTGAHSVYLSSYRSRRKIVSMYKWNPKEALELLEREQITIFIAPSALTGDLLRAAAGGHRDLSCLATIGGGGAPRSRDQVLSIPQIVRTALPQTGWGMTETNAIGARISGLDYLERPTSSGRCAAVLDMKIVDDHGAEVPPHMEGDLLVRGASLFAGYWNDAAATDAAFDRGWFRTGDLAYLDDQGFLFIVGRKKRR